MNCVRTIGWPVVAITVALAALIATPRPAYGCSPPNPPISLSDYAADTEVAFAGRQIARIEPNDPSYHSALSRSSYGITLIFEVERVYKGRAGPLLAARTAYGDGDCGVDYGNAGTIGIAARKWTEGGWRVGEPGDLTVSFWVSRYTIREMEEVFGPGYPPDEAMVQVRELLENPDLLLPETPPPPDNAQNPVFYWLIGGAAAVLLGGTALAYRLRAGNRAGREADSADYRTTGEQ